MIRKILIGILVVLLGVLSYNTITNGVNIGSFEAFGLTDLKSQNDKLDSKINQASELTGSKYKSELEKLNSSTKNLLSKKEEYTDLTTYSSPEQVKAATELDDYEVEYLWANIGNYATKEGIKIKMDITVAANGETTADGRSLYDLAFTAEGSYVGIAMFMADLQDDSFLEFKIENFVMTGEQTLRATFDVKDIPIKIGSGLSEGGSDVEKTTIDSNSNSTTNTTMNSGSDAINSVVPNSIKVTR